MGCGELVQMAAQGAVGTRAPGEVLAGIAVHLGDRPGDVDGGAVHGPAGAGRQRLRVECGRGGGEGIELEQRLGRGRRGRDVHQVSSEV